MSVTKFTQQFISVIWKGEISLTEISAHWKNTPLDNEVGKIVRSLSGPETPGPVWCNRLAADVNKVLLDCCIQERTRKVWFVSATLQIHIFCRISACCLRDKHVDPVSTLVLFLCKKSNFVSIVLLIVFAEDVCHKENAQKIITRRIRLRETSLLWSRSCTLFFLSAATEIAQQSEGAIWRTFFCMDNSQQCPFGTNQCFPHVIAQPQVSCSPSMSPSAEKSSWSCSSSVTVVVSIQSSANCAARFAHSSAGCTFELASGFVPLAIQTSRKSAHFVSNLVEIGIALGGSVMEKNEVRARTIWLCLTNRSRPRRRTIFSRYTQTKNKTNKFLFTACKISFWKIKPARAESKVLSCGWIG